MNRYFALVVSCCAFAWLGCTVSQDLGNRPPGKPDSGSGDAGPKESGSRVPEAGDSGRDAAPDANDDPNNCGRRGHDCQGGLCIAGACQPVVLASSFTPLAVVGDAVAVDAKSVYFFTSQCPGDAGVCFSTVQSVSIAGGLVSSLGQISGNHLLDLAVGTENVYLTNNQTDAIMSVPIVGGSATTLASGQGNPLAVALDSTSVYWTNGGGSVVKTGLSGGTPQTLVSGGVSNPQGVAVDATGVYWTNWSFGGLETVSLDGGTPSTLADASQGGAITVSNGRVYWAQGALVTSVATSGGSVTTIASGQDYPFGIAADDTYVYWGLDVMGGAILAAPLSGGSAITLATGQNLPRYIAVGASAVFWATTDSVTKVAKP